jgi:hypothetical protein
MIAIATRTSAAAPLGIPAVLPELNGLHRMLFAQRGRARDRVPHRRERDLYATRSSPTARLDAAPVPGAAPPNGVTCTWRCRPTRAPYTSTTRAGGVVASTSGPPIGHEIGGAARSGRTRACCRPLRVVDSIAAPAMVLAIGDFSDEDRRKSS